MIFRLWGNRRRHPARPPLVSLALDGRVVARFRPSGNPDTWNIIVSGVRARHVSPN